MTDVEKVALEFRPDSRGEFDELVARYADGMVFFEDLGENGLCVCLSWDDGRYCTFWASAKRGKLAYSHEDGDGDPPKYPSGYGSIAAHNSAMGEMLKTIEAEARRFAGFYSQGSDGRNTFVIFADKIATLAKGSDQQ